MPTRQQLNAILEKLEQLQSLPQAERDAAMDGLDWSGFSEAQKRDVELRVDENESGDFWMDGVEPDDPAYEELPIDPEQLKGLMNEIRQDEHAARVRDYGPEDAATYDQRVEEGAQMPVTEWQGEFGRMIEAVADPPRSDYDKALDQQAEQAKYRQQQPEKGRDR